MTEKAPLPQDKAIHASGFSNGELILIKETKKSPEVFMILFHEMGHNIDKQFDIKEVTKPLAEIKNQTISFSQAEAKWLLAEAGKGWPSVGISNHHLNIMQKILDVILVEGTDVKRTIKSISAEDLESVIAHSGVLGSVSVASEDDPEKTSGLKIVDSKQHRNSEMPADFVQELMIDVFNRSINKHFALEDSTKTFTSLPDERNLKTVNIARYMIERNWRTPGFWYKKIAEAMGAK